jgi:hypothetical protein
MRSGGDVEIIGTEEQTALDEDGMKYDRKEVVS